MEFLDLFRQADSAILSRLGEDGTLDGVTVRGVLSLPISQAEFSGSMSGFQEPVFRLPNDQASAAVLDSELVVRGESYRVINIEPDGSGLTGLALRLT